MCESSVLIFFIGEGVLTGYMHTERSLLVNSCTKCFLRDCAISSCLI